MENLHPFVIHLPIAVSLLVPLIILYSIYLEYKKSEFTNNLILVVLYLSVSSAIFSILSLVSGEAAEEIVEKFIPETPLDLHEDLAEIFSTANYILAILSFLLLFTKRLAKRIMLYLLFLVSISTFVLALATGFTGGKLVYEYKAANYINSESIINTNKKSKFNKDRKKIVKDDEDDHDHYEKDHDDDD